MNATPTETTAARAPAPEAPPGQPPALTLDGHCATITLRRPQVANRLEPEDLALLLAQVREVDARPEVRVLRLCGEGRHLCSGFNIGRVGNTGGNDPGALFEVLAEAIERARPVTLAVIPGGVYGGGTDLALACDFRLGVSTSEMFVPAAKLGIHFYGGGLRRAVQRLGLGAAKRIFLTGDRLDATAMREAGFLDEVLPDAAVLADRVAALSAQIAALAPLAVLGMKKHLDAIARGQPDADALAADIALAAASDDLREGALAWREKRPPVFRGR